MFQDIRKNKIFSRRLLVVGGVQSALATGLIARLGYLQIFKHEQYSIQSDSNRIKPVIHPAPRGIIYDRNNIPLTTNDENYHLLLYLGHRKNNSQIIEKVIEILDVDEETASLFFAKLKHAKRKNVISLSDNLPWHDLARIEANLHILPGISIEQGILRHYLYPQETAHFIGYVSLPSEKEIDDNEQTLFMHPDFRIGKAGIERSFDQALRGKYGARYVEVNVHEIPIRTLSTKEPEEGSKVHLTIDFPLQKFAYERIKDDAASVVLMDVITGEVLIYAASPSFDPNNFVEGVSRKYWSELNSDPKTPLNNRPIAALYPPGSTFKLMTTIAALESDINPHNHVYCNGHFQFGKRAFHCWKEGGHGSVNMLDAITQSCNTYFFSIANNIGIKKIAEVARRFGYGEKLDVSIHGVKAGVVPDEEWKRTVLNQPWVGGDNLNTVVGQGYLLTTPLQMATITARIANGGVPIKPYLVRNKNIYEQFDQLSSKKITKQQHLRFIQEGMNRVVNDPSGTAYGKRINIKDFEMAGKTGTSQVISKREKEMSKADLMKNHNHAIFVAFAPTHDPQYAISVVVEHGKSGSGAAAPIARDILTELYNTKLAGKTGV